MEQNRTFLGHPIGFWFIFWGELAERAAFYGMRAILALFLVDQMHFDKGQSGMTASFFSAGCYLMCLAGGWVSDKFLGKFWTVIVFAVPYLIGYPLLGMSAGSSHYLLYIALVLLALGSGVVKPNVSPLMASLYNGKPKELKDQAFAWFYAAINIGAGITSLTTPWIRTHYGFMAAFLTIASVMFVALVVFYCGKKYYPKNELLLVSANTKNASSYDYTKKREDKEKLWRVLGVFAMIVFFFAMYDQSMANWVFFAQDHMVLYGIDPDQFQALNPWLIVLLTPLFTVIWRRLKITKATQKMKIGFVLTATCMAIMAFAGYSAVDHKVTSLWLILAYVVVSFAELCISVVGLQFAYDEAPEHMKAKMTSFFLCSVFVGDLGAGFLSKLYAKMDPGNYFGLMTIVMVVISILFVFVARNFEQNKSMGIPDIALDVAES